MTARVMNPDRRVTSHDWYDNEIAMIPPAYVDFIVTERGTANIINQRCSEPKKQGSIAVCNLQGIIGVLSNLRENN